MSFRMYDPEAKSFVPGPNPPPSPATTASSSSGEEELELERWASFTLSAHPSDPLGLIPHSYSVRPIVCSHGPPNLFGHPLGEVVDANINIDGPKGRGETIMANLAPIYAELSPYSRPIDTFTVQICAWSPMGIAMLEALHTRCKARAYAEDSKEERPTLYFLSQLNLGLDVFNVTYGDLVALRAEIVKMQVQMFGDEEDVVVGGMPTDAAGGSEEEVCMPHNMPREAGDGVDRWDAVLREKRERDGWEEVKERITRMPRPVSALNKSTVPDVGSSPVIPRLCRAASL